MAYALTLFSSLETFILIYSNYICSLEYLYMYKIYSWKNDLWGITATLQSWTQKKLRLSTLGLSQWVMDGSESIGDLQLPTKVLVSKRFKNKRRHCLQLMYTSCLFCSFGGVPVPIQHCWQIPITHCFLHHPIAWLIYFPIFPSERHLFLLLREAFEAFVTDWMSLSQARSSVGWILFLQYNTIRFTELCQACSLFSLNFTLCSGLTTKLYMHEYSTKWHISGKWYGQCWLYMVKEDMWLLKVALWCPHTSWNCCTQIHIGPQQIHIREWLINYQMLIFLPWQQKIQRKTFYQSYSSIKNDRSSDFK